MAKFCERCGNRMEDSDVFCQKCGAAYQKTAAGPIPAAAARVHAPPGRPHTRLSSRPTGPRSTAEPTPRRRRKRTGLIAGIVIGASALVLAVAGITWAALGKGGGQKPTSR